MAGPRASSGRPRPSGGSPRRSSGPGRGSSRPRSGAARPALDTRVRILDGPAAGTEYAIAGSVVRLGRGDDNDIILPDSNASRNHAELVRDGSNRYVVRDVGSRNGILVNRRKVPQAVLKNGDRVTIGGTTVEFLSGDGPPAGGAARRWLVVAAAAGILGFALVSFGGGSAKRDDVAAIVITGTTPAPVTNTAPTPPPVVGADGVSMASLFATAQTSAPGSDRGTTVGRNQPTKAVDTPLPNLPKGLPAEKMVAAIMAEGERAYVSGRLVEARDYFDRATKLDPNCERCVNRYDSISRQIEKEIADALAAGATYMETQRWDQAIGMFEKVKFLDPDPASINNANATAYIDTAKQKKASGGR